MNEIQNNINNKTRLKNSNEGLEKLLQLKPLNETMMMKMMMMKLSTYIEARGPLLMSVKVVGCF